MLAPVDQNEEIGVVLRPRSGLVIAVVGRGAPFVWRRRLRLAPVLAILVAVSLRRGMSYTSLSCRLIRVCNDVVLSV